MSSVATRPATRTRVLAAAAPYVLLASLAGFVVVWLILVHAGYFDALTYRAEGEAARHGTDIYGPLPKPFGYATYPPFPVYLFVVLTLGSTTVVGIASAVVNIALTGWVALLSLRLAGAQRITVAAVCLVWAIALWSEPVTTTISYGQINLLVLGLVLWDLTRPSGARLRGAAIGLAAAIKLTPAAFLVYLLLTRRIREAVTGVLTVVVTIAVSFAINPSATRRFWTSYVWHSDRIGRLENVANQSLRGVFVRATHTRASSTWEMLITGIVLLAGVAIAVLAHRRLGDSVGAPALAVTALLVPAIAWTHHWVWCIPIGVLLWLRAPVLRWVALAVFCSHVVWALPRTGTAELHLDAWQVIRSALYVAFGLVFLGWALLQAVKAGRAHLTSATPRGTRGGRSRSSVR